jgi:hypothetical protein
MNATKCPVCRKDVKPEPGVTILTLEYEDEDMEITSRALIHDSCLFAKGDEEVHAIMVEDIKVAAAMAFYMETHPQAARNKTTLN